MTDAFTAIANRERAAALAPAPTRPVKAWAIVSGDGTRVRSRLYSATRARRIAARARRFGIDVYVSVFGVVNVTAAQRARM